MNYRVNGFPDTAMTSPKPKIGRLQVDVGSTGFFDNRESRYFREFEIPNNQSVWIRVVVPEKGIIIKSQVINLESGQIKFRAWRDLTINGVTFVEPSTPEGASDDPSLLCSGHFRLNGLPSAPPYTMLTEITEGGNHTSVSGGICSEVKRLKTANANAQKVSVGLTFADERGVPPGTYHLQIASINNSTAAGVYELKYEERLGEG